MQQMRSHNSHTVNKNVFSLFLNAARLTLSDSSKILLLATFSFPDSILYISIRSLLFLRVSNVVSPRRFSLSPDSNPFSPGTISVAAPCTCSRHRTSTAWWGTMTTQYSKCVLGFLTTSWHCSAASVTRWTFARHSINCFPTLRWFAVFRLRTENYRNTLQTRTILLQFITKINFWLIRLGFMYDHANNATWQLGGSSWGDLRCLGWPLLLSVLCTSRLSAATVGVSQFTASSWTAEQSRAKVRSTTASGDIA